MDTTQWPSMKKIISERFLQKTQQEWTEIFEDTDACVTPVLDLLSASHHPHNLESSSFMKNNVTEKYEPLPAPRLSRTPAHSTVRPDPKVGEHTFEVLKESGFSDEEINDLERECTIEQWKPKSSL